MVFYQYLTQARPGSPRTFQADYKYDHADTAKKVSYLQFNITVLAITTDLINSQLWLKLIINAPFFWATAPTDNVLTFTPKRILDFCEEVVSSGSDTDSDSEEEEDSYSPPAAFNDPSGGVPVMAPILAQQLSQSQHGIDISNYIPDNSQQSMIAQAGTSNIIKLTDTTSTDHTPAPHVAREARLNANLPYPLAKPSTESLKDRSKLPSSAKQFGLKSAVNSPKESISPCIIAAPTKNPTPNSGRKSPLPTITDIDFELGPLPPISSMVSNIPADDWARFKQAFSAYAKLIDSSVDDRNFKTDYPDGPSHPSNLEYHNYCITKANLAIRALGYGEKVLC